MRKFGVVFKEKQNISERKKDQKVLAEFKEIYSSLLEAYGVPEFHKLDKRTQDAFIGELNEYWTEEDGILPKGQKFLKTKSSKLTESSTSSQKRNYLKKRISTLVSESIRQSDIKTQIYKVLDEMYKETKSTDINQVLNAKEVNDVILESFGANLEDLMTEINYELTEPKKKKIYIKK